ncbi:hypothetical protein HYH03_005597 [Edaphochlamys debaryana]|uniref:Uncharacterized protein n=1 Tax=Edaphochlamys debaryana TaxID=47281 RepID=A0A835Y5H7_9CHLO|nr:hypothetical protein HYH03_005597 [Edaphochlamys debaryana]|eukprot:KAG2496368.1 hypothetical protein HYH03_005597 [Edaphochlamys debaryana]
MAELAELERAKRRRLQEAYADLRPAGSPSPAAEASQRSAKLKSLLLGPGHTSSPAAARSPAAGAGAASAPAASAEEVRALAAAAAANLLAVGSSQAGAGQARPRRAAALSERSASAPTATGAGLAAGGGGGPGGWAQAQAQPRPQPSQLRPRCAGGRGGARAPPPPPDPHAGGFLRDADPVHRLSALAAMGVSPLGVGAPAGPVPRMGPGPGAAPQPAAPPQPWRSDGGGRRYNDPMDDDDEALAEAIPSDVEVTLISLRCDLRSHPGCEALPPLALRSQLAALMPDRSDVERQLDEQRRANRVRVFKLPTGLDEFAILTTPEYRALLLQTAEAEAAAEAARAAALAGGDAAGSSGAAAGRSHSAPGALAAGPSGAYGASGVTAVRQIRSRWHAAVDVFLRAVVDRYTDFELSHEHLIRLLATAPPPARATAPAAAYGAAAASGQAAGPAGGQDEGSRARLAPLPSQALLEKRRQAGAGTEAGAEGEGQRRKAAMTQEQAEELVSSLLHLGCIARHTDGDADAFVLAVPGAGRMVQAVAGGRRELLVWLSKRMNKEATEAQIAQAKLRSTFLPASFHFRDLVGRGSAIRMETTIGPVIKLTPTGVAAAAAAAKAIAAGAGHKKGRTHQTRAAAGERD